MKNIKSRIIFGFGPKIELLKNNHERLNLLEKAYEKGFRIYETAPVYCFGMSERILGQFYEKRKEIKIYTKFGINCFAMPKVFEKSNFLVKNFRRFNNRLFYPYKFDYKLKNLKSSYNKSIRNIKTKPLWYLFHGINKNLTHQEYLNLKHKLKDLGFDKIGFASNAINYSDFSFDKFDVIQIGIGNYFKHIAGKISLENKKIILYGVYRYYLENSKNVNYNTYINKLLKDLPENISIVMASTKINTIDSFSFE